MTSPDPIAERHRLAALYASKTDEELQHLADGAEELTDIAREALREEFSRRGSSVVVHDQPRQEVPSSSLVTVRRFRDLPSADLAKNILDSAGIECFLYDENVIGMNWLWSNALGGIKLRVREEDAQAAAELLDQGPAEKFEVGDAEEFTQPKCPLCGSVNVTFGEQGKRLAYATIAVGVPLPVERDGWKCESCGHVWQDSEDSSRPTSPNTDG